MTRTILKLAVAIAVGVFVLGLAMPQAHAQLMSLCLTAAPGDVSGDCTSGAYDSVFIQSDGTIPGTTITSNGVTAVLGVNVIVGPGEVIFQGGVDGWNINVSTGTTNGNLGIDLNSLNITSAVGSLDVYFWEDGVTGNNTYTAQIGGTNPAGGTTAYDGCLNNNDTGYFCTDNAGLPFQQSIGQQVFTSAGGFSANYGNVNPTGLGSPFEIFEELNLTATGGSETFSGDYGFVATPEPTSVLLLTGVVLAVFGAIRRKTRLA